MAEEKRDPALETEETAVQPQDASPKKEKEPETLEGMIYCWAQALITAVVSVVLLFTFGVRLISVNGPSMQNTLYTGDELLILNSMFCAFKAGDVVVLNAYNAEEPLSETLVKRIVAVGGQTVDVDPVSGTVTVDGQELDEPYIKEPTYTTAGTQFPLHAGGGRGLRHGGQPQRQPGQPGPGTGGGGRALPHRTGGVFTAAGTDRGAGNAGVGPHRGAVRKT